MGNRNLIDTTKSSNMKLTLAIIYMIGMIGMCMGQMPVPQGVTCVNNNGTWMPTAASKRRMQSVVNYYACPYIVTGRRRLQSVVPSYTQKTNNGRRLQGVALCPVVTISGFKFQCFMNTPTTRMCPTNYQQKA